MNQQSCEIKISKCYILTKDLRISKILKLKKKAVPGYANQAVTYIV